MTLLQKIELHKTISAVNGSSLERGNTIVVAGCKWGSGLIKSRLCFLTSKKHKQDYKQRGTTTWG